MPSFNGKKKVKYKDEPLIASLPGDLRRIARVAGLDAALRIARAFRGTYIYIPGLDTFYKNLRDLKIRRDYDSGLTGKTIAEKYGIAERTVRRVLKEDSAGMHNVLDAITDDVP